VSTAIFNFFDVSLSCRLRLASQSVTKRGRIIQISGCSAMAFAKIYSFNCKCMRCNGLRGSGFCEFPSFAKSLVALWLNETHFFGNTALGPSQKRLARKRSFVVGAAANRFSTSNPSAKFGSMPSGLSRMASCFHNPLRKQGTGRDPCLRSGLGFCCLSKYGKFLGLIRSKCYVPTAQQYRSPGQGNVSAAKISAAQGYSAR